MKNVDIEKLVAPAIAALGYEFVGCEQTGAGRQTKIRVYIDYPGGVTVDDCADVSRQITALFAVEAPEMQEVELEVSSPGIERPLFTLAQFQQFIGYTIKLKLKIPVSGRRRFKGVLQTAAEDQIVVQVEGEDWTFTLSNIERANLSPDF